MDSGSPPAWLLWAIANGSGFMGPGCSLQEMVGRELHMTARQTSWRDVCPMRVSLAPARMA